jgi:hypothetical protein
MKSLAIASEQSQHGLTPRKMKFDDPAFDFIPWGQPLSDPRKAQITVKQLLNHTSGICPEATGSPNYGDAIYLWASRPPAIRCVGEPHRPVQANEKQPSVFVVHCLVHGENVFTRMV